MVFYIIGLGLADETDITYKGLQAVKSCDIIYLEHYTSILGVQKEKLEEFYGKTITLADRETCEETIDEILKNCKANEDKNSAVLVVGDPFCATTHTDMFLRAVKIGLKVEVIHNASIMNAVACCGLQLYRFGETVTFLSSLKIGDLTVFMRRLKRIEKATCILWCLLISKSRKELMKISLRIKRSMNLPDI